MLIYHMIKRNCKLQALSIVILSFLFACKSSYQISQTKRQEYPINNDVKIDSSIMKLYNPYKIQMEAEMNQVIAHSDVLMSKVDSDKNPESLLSNFFADATFSEALKIDQHIDFAMPTTKGGLRVDIPKGNVTRSNIFETMPFENELIVFTLTGADTKELLTAIARNNGEPVSGLRLDIIDKKPQNVMINGKAFDPSKTYNVLTTDYISGGGDNFQNFKTPLATKMLGLKVRTALINYVQTLEKNGKTINPKLDGRIIKK
jgi:2',3'-cyclic-nucleotide 2'-phosphodiesterase (5'-nucleotidase family)